MSCFDGQYTKVVKPTASYTVVPKMTASYTVIAEPCYETLALLTQHGIPILHQDGRTMVRQG